MKYASDYQTKKVYHFRHHETKLIPFDGSENILKHLGSNPKTPDSEQLQADYNDLLAKKTELQKTYKSAEKEISDLNRKLSNIRQYLG